MRSNFVYMKPFTNDTSGDRHEVSIRPLNELEVMLRSSSGPVGCRWLRIQGQRLCRKWRFQSTNPISSSITPAKPLLDRSSPLLIGGHSFRLLRSSSDSSIAAGRSLMSVISQLKWCPGQETPYFSRPCTTYP